MRRPDMFVASSPQSSSSIKQSCASNRCRHEVQPAENDEATATHEMLRVLHYSTWQVPCGIAGYTADLVGELQRIGCLNTVRPIPIARTSVAGWREELDALCEQARRHDVLHIQHEFGFFRTHCGSVRDSNAVFSHLLHRLQREEIPTVVTFHTDFAALRPSLPGWFRRVLHFAKRLGVSYECALTNLAFNWKSSRKWSQPTCGFRAVVHSPRTKAGLVGRGIGAAHISVLPIGIAGAQVTPTPQDRVRAREMLGLPRDAVLMSIYGFVSANKGHLIAKRALAHLPDDYHLVVVGGTHPECVDRTLNKLLNEPNPSIAARIHVSGYVTPEQSELYKQATDLVLAPYRDPDQSGSAAINWGLSSGKPVIAGNIPVFRELNQRAKCLQLVTPNAVHELAWQIKRVMSSPALQQELVEAAHAYVRHSSCAAVAESTRKIYENLVRSSVGLDYSQAA